MATVVLVGTLDTKSAEYGFVRDRIRAAGLDVVLVDTGVLGGPGIPADVSRTAVASAVGEDLADLVAGGDRGTAVAAMARGAEQVVLDLHADGRLDAVLALGGSGGTSIASRAMRALPVGVPKLLVSTVAAGDTRPYVGDRDLTMMYSIVDISGINRISERVLRNAAAAVVGMAREQAAAKSSATTPDRPLVGATMFGVTTPSVEAARSELEALGYEVLVFHATGTGGKAMESLVRAGEIGAVLDVTTTELADDLVGGVCSAGPERLRPAGEAGVPQVVSLGALDMVNFGPLDTVPERFRDRRLHQHNPAITLLRTDPDECAELGQRIARKLNDANGPVSVFVPLRGVSMVSVAGQVFHDPEADAALFEALRAELSDRVDLVELDTDINDPEFARAMVRRLDEYCRRAPHGRDCRGRRLGPKVRTGVRGSPPQATQEVADEP